MRLVVIGGGSMRLVVIGGGGGVYDCVTCAGRKTCAGCVTCAGRKTCAGCVTCAGRKTCAGCVTCAGRKTWPTCGGATVPPGWAVGCDGCCGAYNAPYRVGNPNAVKSAAVWSGIAEPSV